MKFKFPKLLLPALIAPFMASCASLMSLPEPKAPEVITTTIVQKVVIGETLLIRPKPTTVPKLKPTDTTRNIEDTALVCAAENKTLRNQVNSLLDALDGHVGVNDPLDIKTETEAPPEEKPKKKWWQIK